MKRLLQGLEDAFPCINRTMLALQTWSIMYFLASWFVPAMQKLACPYLQLTGRGCLLCGYTRMCIGWFRDGSPMNRALACFLICFFLQLGGRAANECWLTQGRKANGCHVLADLAGTVAMGVLCLGMFWTEGNGL